MEQFNIFDFMYEKFRITKPIKLIEFFAGIGSQAKALKNLGIPFEHHRICEWAIPSILAYASIHRDELPHYKEEFCADLTKEQLVDELYKMGISSDYNSPCTIEKLKRMPLDKLQLIYNSIQWENNLVDISRTKGCDLGIMNKEEYQYILTYSFP